MKYKKSQIEKEENSLKYMQILELFMKNETLAAFTSAVLRTTLTGDVEQSVHISLLLLQYSSLFLSFFKSNLIFSCFSSCCIKELTFHRHMIDLLFLLCHIFPFLFTWLQKFQLRSSTSLSTSPQQKFTGFYFFSAYIYIQIYVFLMLPDYYRSIQGECNQQTE